MNLACYGCRKEFDPDSFSHRVCPTCRQEFDDWLRGVLRPACRSGEDPLPRLYGKAAPAPPPARDDD